MRHSNECDWLLWKYQINFRQLCFGWSLYRRICLMVNFFSEFVQCHHHRCFVMSMDILDKSNCTSPVFHCHYSHRNNENCHKIFHFYVSIIQEYAVHTTLFTFKAEETPWATFSRKCAAWWIFDSSKITGVANLLQITSNHFMQWL